MTTLFDAGSSLANTRAIADRIDANDVRGPPIRTAGEPRIARAAMPHQTVLAALGLMPGPSPEVATADQAFALAAPQLDLGIFRTGRDKQPLRKTFIANLPRPETSKD